VGIGLRESAAEVRKFGKELGIEFPLWIDPEGQTAVAFGLWGHPSTVLLDRAGRLVGRLRGERDWSTPDARRLVEMLLAERQQSEK
jgi:peroxiredoxin